MRAPTLYSAYTDGIGSSLWFLGWLAGALTVILALTLAALLLLWAIQPLERVVRRRYTSHRLHAQARRSGRT